MCFLRSGALDAIACLPSYCDKCSTARPSNSSIFTCCGPNRVQDSPLCGTCEPNHTLSGGNCVPCTETNSGLVLAMIFISWGYITLYDILAQSSSADSRILINYGNGLLVCVFSSV